MGKVGKMLAVVIALASAACGDDGGSSEEPDAAPDAATPGAVTLSGAVLKGPMEVNSEVDVRGLDALGEVTGDLFSTTTNALGEYSISLSYRGSASISATGVYFDEIAGAISEDGVADDSSEANRTP